jgi:transposase
VFIARLPPKKQSGDACVGRSRGGLTTTLHLRVNEHGLALQLELSPDHGHDAPLAQRLLQDLPKGTNLLADRGYNADWIRDLIQDRDCTPVIPPKSNRRDEIPLSKRKIQEAQSHRALLQQTQAVPPHRQAL